MSDTPKLDLPLLDEAQENPDVPINEGRYIVDALLQGGVLDRELTSPPGGEIEGDAYLLADSGLSGAFAGHASDLAVFQGGGYRFYQPRAGWLLWVEYDGAYYRFDGGSPGGWVPFTGSEASIPIEIQVALSDMTTDLTTGAGKAYIRAPCDFDIDEVRSSLFDASSSGLVTVDINKNGSTILSTKLSIDATEQTSRTAATPAVVSDTEINDDDELIFDIDAAGTDAKGLIVTVIGTRT